MRIVGGDWRGRRLESLKGGDAAAHLRPTSDRVRESLFNVLSGGRFGDPITGARVLDLFAGTGALGFEALSRGASHATFVDKGRKAQGLIRANGRMLGARFDALAVDATRLPPCPDVPCDLVFLDPPYGKGLGEKALASATAGGWIAGDALILWEENAPPTAPEGFEMLDTRKYGGTHVAILRHVA